MATFCLEEMFRSIYSSIVEAASSVQDAAVDSMRDRFFDQSADGSYVPKVLKLSLPHAEAGKVELKTFDVPLFSLSKHTAMAIDELTMDFELELKSIDDGTGKKLMAAMPRGWFSKASTAKITVKFKGADPAEGVMLLNDKAHAFLPK